MVLPAAVWIAGTLLPGSAAAGALTLFWLAIPFASFYALGWVSADGNYRPLLPLSVIALVWINDTFAYLTGSRLGRHPMTPRLSPGKTWEGSIGGALFTLLAGWVVYRVTGAFTPLIWLMLVIIVCLLGLAGDLFESGLKRKHQVKDTGSLLPGHGGILDRFDSLLLVSPALLLLLVVLNLLR
jgi:phosphatidate cytidylyltransferase